MTTAKKNEKIPEKIIKKANYVFFTKENEVLDWPEHAIFFWRDFHFKDKKIRISRTVADYGWAGLLHVKRLGTYNLIAMFWLREVA